VQGWLELRDEHERGNYATFDAIQDWISSIPQQSKTPEVIFIEGIMTYAKLAKVSEEICEKLCARISEYLDDQFEHYAVGEIINPQYLLPAKDWAAHIQIKPTKHVSRESLIYRIQGFLELLDKSEMVSAEQFEQMMKWNHKQSNIHSQLYYFLSELTFHDNVRRDITDFMHYYLRKYIDPLYQGDHANFQKIHDGKGSSYSFE
jgi:hypothetical protein